MFKISKFPGGTTMNLLPDMIVLDFCEWLKTSIIPNCSDFDLLDLLLDERYNRKLRSYAEEFLYQYKPSIKDILHQYIESEYFDESLNSCRDSIDRICSDHLCSICDERLIHSYFHEGEFDRSISQYVKRICQGNREGVNYKNIRPYELADSAAYLFFNARKGNSKKEENPIIQFMNNLDLDLNVEIDFLEWLIKNDSKYIDIRKMPLRTFEILVDRFLMDCGKNKNDKQKLIKSFKQSDFKVLTQKLLSVLPKKQTRKANNLRYIIERYQNENVKFKCAIFPRKADAKEYKELIEKRWIDLHYVSGNYLDIYYTETDYGKSGYEIMNRMNFIPSDLKAQAPIIVIWENNLQNAKGVDISRLNNEDIFEIIQGIVNSIRKEQHIERIVEEANKMSKELRERHRAVSYNTVNITGGTVNGNVAAVNSGEMHTIIKNEVLNSELLSEIETAKQIICGFNEIDELHRERLISMIAEVKSAIENNDKEAQEKNKKGFKDAIFFMGNVGSKLIAALSGLANVLKFFGVSPV